MVKLRFLTFCTSYFQMLSDNLDFQESIFLEIKDRASDVLELFPLADVDKAKVKLISLDQRFLFVKERLQRRQEEMLKSSVDWHEFECGLKSCLEWALRAEDRLSGALNLLESEVDVERLKVSEVGSFVTYSKLGKAKLSTKPREGRERPECFKF